MSAYFFLTFRNKGITILVSSKTLVTANGWHFIILLYRTKYCSFMPVEIILSKRAGEQEYQTIEEDELRDDDVIAENNC